MTNIYRGLCFEFEMLRSPRASCLLATKHAATYGGHSTKVIGKISICLKKCRMWLQSALEADESDGKWAKKNNELLCDGWHLFSFLPHMWRTKRPFHSTEKWYLFRNYNNLFFPCLLTWKEIKQSKRLSFLRTQHPGNRAQLLRHECRRSWCGDIETGWSPSHWGDCR